MGYILPEFFKSLNAGYPKTFIETGTFKGGIPHRIMERNASRGLHDLLDYSFDKYYTIELDEQICAIASKRYQNFENYRNNISFDLIHSNEPDLFWTGRSEYFDGRLNLIQGDSATILWDLLPNINGPIAFWLDAHAGAMKYARGKDDVPLLRELEAINSHACCRPHIIAIDDIDMFGQVQYDTSGNKICDYTPIQLEQVTALLKEINQKFEVIIVSPYGMNMLVAFQTFI